MRQTLSSKLCDLVRYYTAQRRDVRLERRLDAELDQTSHAMRGLTAPGGSPSDEFWQREKCVRVADALAVLPDHYRQVIILRHMQGLTFPAIGQRMERSEHSVKKLWVRALASLREAIKEDFDE